MLLTKEGLVSQLSTEGARPSVPAQRGSAWSDEGDEGRELPYRRWSREEAQALTARQPSVSPWRVVAVQALTGLVLAIAAWLIWGRIEVVASVLYGSAVVVVPAMWMARAATSRLSVLAPGYAAVSFMMWEFGKILVSVAMLALAPKVLHTVVWPALLLALIVCIKIYWVALLWRGSKKR